MSSIIAQPDAIPEVPVTGHRQNFLDRFFVHHQPHVLLNIFLPYHLLFSVAKILWMIWHLIKEDAHKIQYDSRTQWKYHIKMSWFWVSNFPVITVLYFGTPHLWIALGLLLNTYYSLYANFDTEFGAIPAAYAAMNSEQLIKGAGAAPDADVTMTGTDDSTSSVVESTAQNG